MRRFVDLAGGPGRARIIVLPMASSEARETGDEQAAEFVALGVAAHSLNLTRAEAETEAASRSFEDVTGIWLSGGDQSRITAVLAGTRAAAAIRARYHAGAVVGGTSAGATVLSTPMITGKERNGDGFLTIARDTVVAGQGLGLLPGAIVDQHFVRRKRHNRLLSLVLEQPHLLGVGVDESTALLVKPDGRWEVLGASVAVVFDARQSDVTSPVARVLGASDVRLHVLSPGSVYDPRSGRTTLAER